MALSRRQFFKVGLSGGAAGLLFGFDIKPALAQSRGLKIARTTETHSICPYCAVSCGVIIHTLGDKAKNVTAQVVHVEGDPDDPINRGTLCPKGASLYHDILNERRLLKPQVRRPGSDHWEDIEWRNAKMLVVDPRFTRTASVADMFCQIRAGTDIAFLGGLINYAIQNNRIAKDYLVNYTNASFIIKEGFKLPEDGLYSGFDGVNKYNPET